MRTTIVIDDELLAQAREITGLKTTKAAGVSGFEWSTAERKSRNTGEVEVGKTLAREGLAHKGVGGAMSQEHPVAVVTLLYRLRDPHGHIAGAVEHFPDREAGQLPAVFRAPEEGRDRDHIDRPALDGGVGSLAGGHTPFLRGRVRSPPAHA
jgi:hypothetical protein